MIATLTKRLRFLTHVFVSVLAVGVLLPTLPLTAVTAISSTSGMSCCPPGSSDHCDARLMSKPPPPPEPMCGLHTSVENGVDTIIATSTSTQQKSTAGNNKSPSLKAPCAIDCCALARGSFKRPNLDLRGLITRKAAARGFTHQSRPRNLPVVLFASEGFDKTVPRGPPEVL
jgi:hypothetical protein